MRGGTGPGGVGRGPAGWDGARQVDRLCEQADALLGRHKGKEGTLAALQEPRVRPAAG